MKFRGDATLVRRFASWFLAQVGLGLCRAIGSIALSIALRVALAIGGAALCACLLSCRHRLLESDPEKLKFDEDFQAFGSPTCPRADQSSTDSQSTSYSEYTVQYPHLPVLSATTLFQAVCPCTPFSPPPAPPLSMLLGGGGGIQKSANSLRFHLNTISKA